MAAIGSDAGISRSEVSRICQGLDAQIQAFLERPLDGCRYPYLYLDIIPCTPNAKDQKRAGMDWLGRQPSH